MARLVAFGVLAILIAGELITNIGANVVSIEDVPYQVIIEVEGITTCSGSIISDQLVLTSASCVDHPHQKFVIKAGLVNGVIGSGSVHRVIGKSIHSRNGRGESGKYSLDDIGVLKVDSPFKFDETRAKVRLTDKEINGSLAILAGWSYTIKEGISSTESYVVHVPIIEKAECGKTPQSPDVIKDNEICAGSLSENSFLGLSGSPLMQVDGIQVGIFSRSVTSGSANKLGIFTDLFRHRFWIENIIKKNSLIGEY